MTERSCEAKITIEGYAYLCGYPKGHKGGHFAFGRIIQQEDGCKVAMRYQYRWETAEPEPSEFERAYKEDNYRLLIEGDLPPKEIYRAGWQAALKDAEIAIQAALNQTPFYGWVKAEDAITGNITVRVCNQIMGIIRKLEKGE